MPQLVLQGDQEVQGVQAPFLQRGTSFHNTWSLEASAQLNYNKQGNRGKFQEVRPVLYLKD